MAQLPSLFFIRARARADPNPTVAKYCLVSTRPIEHPVRGRLWKMNVIEGSKHLVSGAVLHEDGIETRPETFFHERDTSHDPSGVIYYENKMWRTKTYIILPGEGLVWEYNMTHANKILPSRYNHVGSGRDTCKKWYFTVDDLHTRNIIIPSIRNPILPAPTVAVASKGNIPTHVFRAFVDMAISKKEECPISMEPLTHENVGCLPCGHLFEKEGVKRALASNGVCPTCRTAATEGDIQVW